MARTKFGNQSPRVFISSTVEDLEAYRQSARDAALVANFQPVMMEYWPANGARRPLSECLREVDQTDVLVAIIAKRYGWVPPGQPPGEHKSITWLECERAIEEGKEVLAFLLDVKLPSWPREHEESYRLQALLERGEATAERVAEVQRDQDSLKKFKEWLGSRGVYAVFTTPEDLKGKVSHALWKWCERHECLSAGDGQATLASVDETAYREWVRNATMRIDVRGIAFRGQQDAASFPMRSLYTDLHARAESSLGKGTEVLRRRQRLTDVIAKHTHSVVVGKPGSGKTTFLHHLANELAGDAGCLPLLLRARDFSEYLQKAKKQSAVVSPEWYWIIEYWLWQSEAAGWGLTKPWLVEQFRCGRVWVLMDGLDELPHHEERVHVIQIIDAAKRDLGKTRWLLTSRPGVLVGKAYPDGFRCFEIDDLSDKEIRSFITSWVGLLLSESRSAGADYQDADGYAASLYNAILEHQDIRAIARNPLMLTAIAVVHWNQKKLPEGRAELYEAIIQWLIDSRRNLPNRMDWRIAKRCYQSLALAMFQNVEGRQIRVGRMAAAEVIAHHFDVGTPQDPVAAALQFLEQEEVDTGILIEQGNGFLEFRHLSFQEFLAACEIASMTDDREKGWWPLIKDRLFESEWGELLRFFPVRLLLLGEPRVNLFVERVLGTRRNASLAETAKVVGFLGRILYDLSFYRYEITSVGEYVQARDQVMQIFTHANLPIDLHTKYEAAVALGRGGDPRLLNPAGNWVRIPCGSASAGAQDRDPAQPNYDEFAEVTEQPVHEFYTGSFGIGKYPVTVQEYARFVESGGYRDRTLWDAAGWEWLTANESASPGYWDRQLSYPNCPVVNVCWYEAQAYCNWLSRRDEEMNYRLPNEDEWEFTARHGQETYSRYCFGNTSPLDLTDEINWESCGAPRPLSRSSPVGMFLLDSSRDGVMDMNGNVLEWVQYSGEDSALAQAGAAGNLSAKYRPQRGGSYNSLAQHCRSACRRSVSAKNRYPEVGFRVLRTHKPIAIKGRLPVRQYQTTLADVYGKHVNHVYSRAEVDERLAVYAARLPGVGAGIVSKLFPQDIVGERRSFDRLPCVMADAPPLKFDFNLLYQDTRLKLGVEEKLGSGGAEEQCRRDAGDLMEIVSVLLRTTGVQNNVLWQDLTDNDLDALTYAVLESYDPNRSRNLLEIGHRVNQLALAALPPLDQLTLEELIEYQIFAGTVWWTHCGATLAEQFPSKGALEINDTTLLQRDLLGKACHLVFLFDDNGELVWDLALISRLLAENPALRVTGIASTEVVSNNTNEQTLRACLEHPTFRHLRDGGRFNIFTERNIRSAIDPSFCSRELMDLLQLASVIYIKGVALFETMQKLPLPTYYAMVVHSKDSQICTGLKKGSGILIRLPPDTAGYVYHRKTLRDIHATINAEL